MTVTCIRNAPWVVAWDAEQRQHYFRNDVDLVFEGSTSLTGRNVIPPGGSAAWLHPCKWTPAAWSCCATASPQPARAVSR